MGEGILRLMCKAFDDMRAEGREEGIEKGFDTADLLALKSLMRKLQCSFEKAADLMSLNKKDRERLSKLV